MKTKFVYFFTYLNQKTFDIVALMKFRLSMLVVFSSLIGFLFGNEGVLDFYKLFFLTIGGSLVTFASNAINQLIERDTDKLMSRTMNRPLPQNRMANFEVVLFIGVCAFSGLTVLALVFNSTTALLSAMSLILYGFFYTPLKKISSFAVFIGAIPGALPPLLGYVAAKNALDSSAIWLFLVQFFWQFPHFWAIAWVSFEDYKKAGIMLLPSKSGRDKASAIIILIYTFLLIPLSLAPLYFENVGVLGVGIICFTSFVFTYQAFRLFRFTNETEAKKLMFYSFGYLLIFLGSIFL